MGTTAPSTKLDVDGTVTATAFVGDGSGLTHISGSADEDWTISGDNVYRSAGNVGIGTTTPVDFLHLSADGTDYRIGQLYFMVDSASDAHLIVDRSANSKRGLVQYQTNGSRNWVAGVADQDDVPGSNGIEYMIGTNFSSPKFWIETDGSVGIGTTSPATKLDVSGTVTATAFVGDGSGLTDISGSTDSDWTIDGDNVYHATGNVGIGTTNPSSYLHVFKSNGGAGIKVESTGAYSAYLLLEATNSDYRWLLRSSEQEHTFDIENGAGTSVLSIDNSGNVGIGYNSDPTTKLDVDGTVTATAFVGDGSGLTNISGSADEDWTITGDDVYRSTGNVGIGTTDPNAKLDVHGSNPQLYIRDYTAPTTRYASIGHGGKISVVGNSWSVRVDGSTRMFIDKTTGNMGIGTTSPSTKLDVDGTVTATAFVGDGSGLTNISGSADEDWTISGDNVYRSAGNVGIGTTTPVDFLHLSADGTDYRIGQLYFMVDSASDSHMILDRANTSKRSLVQYQTGGSRTWVAGLADSDDIAGASGTEYYIGNTFTAPKFWIESDGNVGIGTTDPTEKLYVSGNIYATGSIDQGSSRVLKEDISILGRHEALDVLQDLHPVKFRYKSDNSHDLRIGFIAEDVPELVACPDRKGLSPMDFVGVLTRVAQEQAQQLEDQQIRIDNLETMVEKLLRNEAPKLK